MKLQPSLSQFLLPHRFIAKLLLKLYRLRKFGVCDDVIRLYLDKVLGGRPSSYIRVTHSTYSELQSWQNVFSFVFIGVEFYIHDLFLCIKEHRRRQHKGQVVKQEKLVHVNWGSSTIRMRRTFWSSEIATNVCVNINRMRH